jgi:hypothetical protein
MRGRGNTPVAGRRFAFPTKRDGTATERLGILIRLRAAQSLEILFLEIFVKA